MNRILRVTSSVLSAFGLAALLACGGGGGGGGGTPSSTITSVTVTPNPGAVNLNTGSTAQFSAAVTGTGSYSSAVAWSATSGTVNSSGLYTAPATPGTYTVTATSTQDASKSGSATVNVTKPLADTLTYTNPTSGTYTLVKNTSKSTATHLVLDLLGPAGSLSGVGFYLNADQAKVTWTTVDAGDPKRVKSATFSNALVESKVSGNDLQAAVYQKGTTAAVSATTSTVLASVALDLKSGIAYSTTPLSFTATAGKAQILNPPGPGAATTAITISVGTLVAN